MKKILNYLGIENKRSMWIFGLMIGLSILWYAPLLIALTWDELPTMRMEYGMMVSAEPTPRTVSTQTINDAGLLVLTRYRDMIHIALAPNSAPDEVWCVVIDESIWKKKLMEIDENKFFGRIRTDENYVGVSCQVGNRTIVAYSIYTSNVGDYPPSMQDYVFTTPVNKLDRYHNPNKCGHAGIPLMIPY